MKKHLLILAVAFMAFACNSNSETKSENTDLPEEIKAEQKVVEEIEKKASDIATEAKELESEVDELLENL